jgi:hypothetical protein
MHLAVTHKEHPCGCHNDASTNLKDHPDVVCISIIQGGERISCNAQQRKSINDYKLRCSDFGELLLAIEQVYREIDRCRRSISFRLWHTWHHRPGRCCSEWNVQDSVWLTKMDGYISQRLANTLPDPSERLNLGHCYYGQSTQVLDAIHGIDRIRTERTSQCYKAGAESELA